MIKQAVGVSLLKSPVLSGLLVVTGLASASVPATKASSLHRPISAKRPVLPLVFEPNMGQTDSSVRFVARGGDYTVFLTGEGAVLALGGAEPVRLRPTCAQTPVAVEGLEPTGGTSNYFRGADSSRWKTGIPNYRRVRYTGACPGVDVTYYGNPQRLEYDFLLAPWTNPDTVRVEYDGVKSLRIAANGDLVLKTGAGDLVQPRPHVYQEIGGRRVVVEAGYRLAGEHGVKFALAGYRRDVPLVIDPVLVYSTYLGGSVGDAGTAIAVDAGGNAYVTGQTLSLDFPIFGAVQPSNGGSNDAFATKISADGQTRLYSTYLGSAGQDFGSSIAVDGSGNAYIAGATTSSTFPTVNAIQTYQGSNDGFVTKLNSTGSGLLYSTYLGGAGADQITGIAVDSTGSAYVAGLTNSTNFPFTPGAFQTSNLGTENAFVAKLSITGNTLVYSTLLGGNSFDLATAIAVDGSGNAYVTGAANSTNFPVTGGAMQTVNAGHSDVFVTKVNASGNGLLYSTFFGGAGDDNSVGIRVDGSGNAYIVGSTTSTLLPMLNAAQGTYGGGTSDAFVAKLNSTGSGLLFSTFLGGSGADTAAGIAIDGSGNSYVTGQTGSANFPSVSALYSTGGTFVTALGSGGNALLYSTRLTGDANDSGGGIAVSANASVYVTGRTTSASFPIQNALQPGKPANSNPIGFVTVIAALVGVPSVVALSPASGSVPSQTFTFTFSDTGGAANLDFVQVLFSQTGSGSGACWIYYSRRYNLVDLINDGATAAVGPAPPGYPTVLRNSQCALDVGATSVTLAGTQLTVVMPVTFQQTFAGTKQVFLTATNMQQATTGWQIKGNWTVSSATTPSVVGLSPASGAGSSQTFTFTYSDTGGASNLDFVQILFSQAGSGSGACWIHYSRRYNLMDLINDSATAGVGPAPPGYPTVLGNSQCVLNIGATSVTSAGTQLTVVVPVTFKPSFAGTKQIFLRAINLQQINTGWQILGSWTVP